MPWMKRRKEAHAFDSPKGKVSFLDLFEGRRQLVIYRAFFEPGVYGWPDHACRGCSMMADQLRISHTSTRETRPLPMSRARPQPDIERLKARMGWTMPWYTITDAFDADFGVDEWHGTNVFFRDGDTVYRTYFRNNRGDEALGRHVELPRHHAARTSRNLGRLARRLSANRAVQVVELARRIRCRAGRALERRRRRRAEDTDMIVLAHIFMLTPWKRCWSRCRAASAPERRYGSPPC